MFHITAEYKSPIQGAAIICSLVVQDNKSVWVYEDGRRVTGQPYTADYRESLNWFHRVYSDMKPTFHLKARK